MRFRPAIDANTGEMYLPVSERGPQLLEEPLLNKGTAFTPEERDALELRGLLPPHTSTMEEQLERVRLQLESKPSPLEQHIYLASLHDRNETLFFRYLLENLHETVPIVYTPVVAEACSHWSRIFRHARGIYVTPADRGCIARVLRSRQIPEAAVIVATDNERILGIGDQGCGGMGIPIGKLALYTVGAGIHPSLTVPVSLDVGTNSEEALQDPLYLGWRAPRLRGEEYWSLVDEFVHAVKEVFPNALLQWEDFANITSFECLDRYREVLPSFNDDIQGTAAVVVAGLKAAVRRTGGRLCDQRVVIQGSGSAGIGIFRQLSAAMVADGLPADQVHRRILVLDSKGLVVEGRSGLEPRKRAVATPKGVVAKWGIRSKEIPLAQVIEHVEPTVLIGVSGHPNQFTEPMIKAMASVAEAPIVMPLSNPTSKAEALPADIIAWSEGRALVATGSPFDDVIHDGSRHRIGQANNVFIFPGVGLGMVVSKARQVTTNMFTAAADALARRVTDDLLSTGALYPPIEEVREVSHAVAHAVAEQAVRDGVAAPIVDVEGVISATMWDPCYLPYRPA
jgi:malic enzyme